MLNADHVGSLVRVELRRHFMPALRLVGFTLLAGALFYLDGKRSPAAQLAILLGASFGGMMTVPMGVFRDQVDGTLEFLAGLPVDPRAIAASRFIAVAALSAPWAIGVGILAVTLPSGLPVGPAGIAIISWMVMLMLGAVLTASVTRFGLQALFGTPTVVALLFVSVAPRIVRMLVPEWSAATLLEFAHRPYTPAVLALCAFVAFALVASAAFESTARAIANYRCDST